MQANAEIVVTFEGTTESGNDFMARQSYLPNELRWGHCFKDMLSHPRSGQTQYTIDFSGYWAAFSNLCVGKHPVASCRSVVVGHHTAFFKSYSRFALCQQHA